jgi:hypothetical protein
MNRRVIAFMLVLVAVAGIVCGPRALAQTKPRARHRVDAISHDALRQALRKYNRLNR